MEGKISYKYVKMVIDSFRDTPFAYICNYTINNKNIKFKYDYLRRVYIIDTINSNFEYKNRIKAIKAFNNLQFYFNQSYYEN